MLEDPRDRLAQADAFLANTSWDVTWSAMAALVAEVIEARTEAPAPRPRRAWAFAD
jgi:hypothetical protein